MTDPTAIPEPFGNHDAEQPGADQPDERAQLIHQALTERGADSPCPRCGNDAIAIEGQLLFTEVRARVDAAPSNLALPTAMVTCTRCGYLSQHALTTLGLAEHPAFIGGGADA